jgi:hypothetical protein
MVKAVACRLVAGISSRRPGFSHRVGHVSFMVNRMVLTVRQVFSPGFLFSLSFIIIIQVALHGLTRLSYRPQCQGIHSHSTPDIKTIVV